jgi:hypothetical protein
MWYHGAVIGFSITDLLDASICMIWLERHLHPEGWKCPSCGSTDCCLFLQRCHFTVWRCRACDDYYTIADRDCVREDPPAPGDPGAAVTRHRERGWDRTAGSRIDALAPPVADAPLPRADQSTSGCAPVALSRHTRVIGRLAPSSGGTARTASGSLSLATQRLAATDCRLAGVGKAAMWILVGEL